MTPWMSKLRCTLGRSTCDLSWQTTKETFLTSHQKVFRVESFLSSTPLLLTLPSFLSFCSKKVKNPDSALSPAMSEPTKEESLELLKCFLDYCSQPGTDFEFWFLLFKELYLSVFYPKIFQELELLKTEGHFLS